MWDLKHLSDTLHMKAVKPLHVCLKEPDRLKAVKKFAYHPGLVVLQLAMLIDVRIGPTALQSTKKHLLPPQCAGSAQPTHSLL